ncbi:MAG: NADH-quinone oxidoreductase subunit L [Planctomycetes bacterium]|nr:NADH-quinone oxidoreductase subunit L [Planctomycetota bacterium]
MNLSYSWVIAFLPFLSFLYIALLTRKKPYQTTFFSIFTILFSFILSCSVLKKVFSNHIATEFTTQWFSIGGLKIDAGIIVDPLSSLMLCIVCLISLLIQIFSRGYMAGDRGFARYYAFISLFTFSMLGLVLSSNLLQMYIFWELVGLCSYLLIGHWYDRPEAAKAAKKAFIVTRIGDSFFFVGVLVILFTIGSLNFHDIETAIKSGTLSHGLIGIMAFLVFCGAIGKSAQFPLHVWLPDAMEGPSPVSALIHAATMVAAGVYLVARAYTLFAASHTVMLIVAYTGGFTALFAGSIAIAQNDLKRVLAYSTVSQLGYMFLALGVGAYSASLFHLTTHACFKALLFLAAGSVVHAMHTRDVTEMGGIFKYMKITSLTFLIGSLSLLGIPPFSGFFSKDEILLAAYSTHNLPLFIMGLITVFFTSVYMFRIFFIAFTGESRAHGHPHESPAVMTIPLIILAGLSVIGGFIGSPLMGNAFQEFIHHEAAMHHAEPSLMVMVISVLIGVAGIYIAWLLCGRGMAYLEEIKANLRVFVDVFKTVVIYPSRSTVGVGEKLTNSFLYILLANKYFVDEIYSSFLVTPFIKLARFAGGFDLSVIDGVVNGVASVITFFGRGVRKLQTGFIQRYIMVLVLGIIFLILVSFFVQSQIMSAK